MLKNIFVLFFFLLSIFIKAEDLSFKWGKVSPEDLRPMSDSTNSGAMILGAFGRVYFDTYHDGEYRLFYERKVRIKILSTSGYKWADVEFEYDSWFNTDRVEDIDGQCIFLNAEGKVEKHDIERKDIIDEVVYKSLHRIHFSIPSVREGSVIEYKYRIVSDNLQYIRPWKFQATIPTQVNQLITRIPDFFDFVPMLRGSNIAIERDASDFTQQIRFNSAGSLTLVHGTEKTYTAKAVPAFIEEPFITSSDDYISKFLFQLRGFQIPGDVQRGSVATWKQLSDKLLLDANFGDQLYRNAFFKEMGAQMSAGIPDSTQKLIAIYKFIQKTIHFNGLHRMWTDDNLRKVYDAKTGCSSDVNFILLLMLKGAGFKCDPVILSTRDNGKLQVITPSYYQFNHAIASVSMKGERLLLDATNPQITFGQLPPEDINGAGLLISEASAEWVFINAEKKARRYIFSEIGVDNDGKFSAKSEMTFDSYYAAIKRVKISEEGQDDFIKKYLGTQIPDLKLSTSNIDYLDSIEMPLKITLNYETGFFSNAGGNMLYLKPLQVFSTNENPFKQNVRDFPVDYNYPREETYIANFSLPDGYEISETPSPIKLMLPDNSVQYLYNINVTGNKLQIMTKLTISKVMFIPEEYPHLKEIYNQIVSKEGEQIVLKKK